MTWEEVSRLIDEELGRPLKLKERVSGSKEPYGFDRGFTWVKIDPGEGVVTLPPWTRDPTLSEPHPFFNLEVTKMGLAILSGGIGFKEAWNNRKTPKVELDLLDPSSVRQAVGKVLGRIERLDHPRAPRKENKLLIDESYDALLEGRAVQLGMPRDGLKAVALKFKDKIKDLIDSALYYEVEFTRSNTESSNTAWLLKDNPEGKKLLVLLKVVEDQTKEPLPPEAQNVKLNLGIMKGVKINKGWDTRVGDIVVCARIGGPGSSPDSIGLQGRVVEIYNLSGGYRTKITDVTDSLGVKTPEEIGYSLSREGTLDITSLRFDVVKPHDGRKPFTIGARVEVVKGNRHEKGLGGTVVGLRRNSFDLTVGFQGEDQYTHWNYGRNLKVV